MGRAFRASDGELLWEHLDLDEGIFTYPVVGRLSEGAPLSVVVGVGSLCGHPWISHLMGWWRMTWLSTIMLQASSAIFLVVLTFLRMRYEASFLRHFIKAGFIAFVITVVVNQYNFHKQAPYFDPPRM